jgi:hypothetical protein
MNLELTHPKNFTMKLRIIISIFITILFLNEISAQDSVFHKGKFYRISLRMNGKKTKNKSLGFLVRITDSTLYYSKNKLSYSAMGLEEYSLDTISFRDIKTVSLYTASPSATVLVPAVTGFMTGAIIGFAQGDDPPGWFSTTAGEKALILGTAGFAAGALIGGLIIIGDHHYYNIKGRKDKFQKLVKFIEAKEFPQGILLQDNASR